MFVQCFKLQQSLISFVTYIIVLGLEQFKCPRITTCILITTVKTGCKKILLNRHPAEARRMQPLDYETTLMREKNRATKFAKKFASLKHFWTTVHRKNSAKFSLDLAKVFSLYSAKYSPD